VNGFSAVILGGVVLGGQQGALRLAALGVAIATCVSCTRAELVHKADAYDSAIWDANNRQILLNAMRASQRAPMSFVAMGEVAASPVVSGSTAATFNLIPSGLSNYSLNPSVNYGGGFATFQMSNLNQQEFAVAMHNQMTQPVVEHFMFEKWPQELIELVLTRSIRLSPGEWAEIQRRRQQHCAAATDERSRDICAIINDDLVFYEGCPHRHEDDPVFLNTAREHCAMTRFQLLTRSMRLLHYKGVIRREYRSAEGILYYLGELIAAQLYSSQLYMPMVMLEASDQHHYLMRLFVVERGNPGPPAAAVQVSFNGEDFYIPRPQLGNLTEDRSLQVLDMATTAIVLATHPKDLPKSNNVNLIPAR
jgi:hypothetical protein